jgi:hypothetical protein
MGHSRLDAAYDQLLKDSPNYDNLVWQIEMAIIKDILEQAERSRVSQSKLWAELRICASDNQSDLEPWECHIQSMPNKWAEVMKFYNAHIANYNRVKNLCK